MRRLTRILGPAIAIAAVMLAGSNVTAAHERHEVGRYVIEMGWRDEPALAGLPNAVVLEVRDKSSDRGIAGLQKTLSVAVSAGGQRDALSLDFLASSEAGVYETQIIPTRAGDYVFRLRGTIDGQSIDERFESGPNRFDSVVAATTIQWPDRSDLREELVRARDEIAGLRVLAAVATAVAVLAALGVAAAMIRSRRATRR